MFIHKPEIMKAITVDHKTKTYSIDEVPSKDIKTYVYQCNMCNLSVYHDQDYLLEYGKFLIKEGYTQYTPPSILKRIVNRIVKYFL